MIVSVIINNSKQVVATMLPTGFQSMPLLLRMLPFAGSLSSSCVGLLHSSSICKREIRQERNPRLSLSQWTERGPSLRKEPVLSWREPHVESRVPTLGQSFCPQNANSGGERTANAARVRKLEGFSVLPAHNRTTIVPVSQLSQVKRQVQK